MRPDLTLTTVCNAAFFWGAIILVCSLRRSRVAAKVHVLAEGLSREQEEMLSQLGDTRVFQVIDQDPRNLCTRKPEALLTAETEWIGWLDSDCMALGDVGPLLIPSDRGIQVRMRSDRETARVYRSLYAPGEAKQGVPKKILRQWQADVGDLPKPRVLRTCVTNAFVMHGSHRPFVELWRRQILKVIPPVWAEITDRSNPAYLLSDESVFSSLMSFSSLAPAPSEFQLDRDRKAHIAHFVENPKPWQRWKQRHWKRYDSVMDLLDWAQAEGFRLPGRPWALRRSLRPLAWGLAAGDGAAAWGKRVGRRMRRRETV